MKTKKKTAIFISIGAVVAAGLVALAILFVIPGIQIGIAEGKIADGDFEEALEILEPIKSRAGGSAKVKLAGAWGEEVLKSIDNGDIDTDDYEKVIELYDDIIAESKQRQKNNLLNNDKQAEMNFNTGVYNSKGYFERQYQSRRIDYFSGLPMPTF
jgi:hypothetical protein